MTEKISEHKVSRMLQFFLEGYSEVSIAQKLKVTQSTVSLYIHRFKEVVDSQGLEKIGKECGTMDRLQSLHDLGAELQKEKLTIEEAKTALRVHSLLQGYGIGEERYSEVILACNKMHSASFAAAAQELATMEKTTGISHQALMQQYHTANDNIVTTRKKLSALKVELNHAGHGLSDMKKKKRLAAKELESDLDNLGLDMKRLERVEELAGAIKQAELTDSDLQSFIEHQNAINAAGISLNYFTAILKKVKGLTAQDKGKYLLDTLTQYGDLVKAKADLEVRIHVLRKQASDLEERQKSKQEVEKHLAVLSSEKADLEKSIGGLSKEKETLTQVKSDVGSLTEQKSLLKVDIDSMRKTKEELCIEIEELTKRTSDLQELDARRNDLSSSLTTIETEISSHKSQMNILNSFLGFIAPSSMSDVEKFVTLLPALLDEAKHKNHSPDILRNIILQTLTGGKLRSLRCTSCKTKFIVNKPSEYGLGYHCPTCWSTLVEVAHDETEILERAMIGPKPQILRVKHSTK